MSIVKIRPEILDNPNNILDLEKNNGRVDVLGYIGNPDVMFKIQERASIHNKATSYYQATAGELEETTLSRVFFSAENIQIIQNGVRAGVYKMSNHKYVIAPPNVEAIKITMRNHYMQYAEHYEDNIKEQIAKLNNLILEYLVPFAYNETIAYFRYCEDQSTLAVPLELPKNHDRNYKQMDITEKIAFAT